MRPVGVRVRLPAPIPAARSFVATHHVPANPVVAPPDPRPRRRITMSWHSAAAGPLSFVQTRTSKGTYVSVEPFQLFRYLDEQAYRFNTRTDKDGERAADVVGSIAGKRLTYKELIGE